MTIFILIITVLISIVAFSKPELMMRMNLNPYQTYHRKEWYRLISHGFLHANWPHLIINMYVLYVFGSVVEQIFTQLKGHGLIGNPQMHFMILYMAGIVISSLSTLFRHKDNYNYNAVGASGAVSAIVFTFIFFAPWEKILFFMIIPVPAIIFGVLYLIYSQYMSKREGDNINHDAHFWGAVFGFLYPLIVKPNLFLVFIENLLHP